MIFQKHRNIERRCYNFENSTPERGSAGKENKGSKGHAFDRVKARESITLFDVVGMGVIDHFWITYKTVDGVLDTQLLRGLRLEMFWDGSKLPAVSVPLGDFFGIGLGKIRTFENDFFACTEGKAFHSYIPMPFLKSAKIVLTNETDKEIINIFYTIDYYLDPTLLDQDVLYFHAAWNRQIKTVHKKDFEILPPVKGSGTYLGASISVIADPAYEGTWWGEGEVKIYLDGDGEYPTLIWTGAEDYACTAWGMNEFCGRFGGCLVAEDGPKGMYSFYRYHIPDPIPFYSGCKVTIQQIGGGFKSKLLELKDQGTDIKIVSADQGEKGFVKIYETDPMVTLEDDIIEADSWCNFYREDDYCATAYFYLDKPNGVLPAAPPAEERLTGLKFEKAASRDDA